MQIMSKDFSEWYRRNADPMCKPNFNRVHYRKGFTEDTMLTTQTVCFFLWKRGIEFATEVKLKNGLRPDIICPELHPSVIEIMDSETDEMFDANKKDWYDKDGITILRLPADPEDAINVLHEVYAIKR